MAYGRRDGFSYADDVPIKLSERMKVPPRITLPIAFNPSISMNILEDYDFSLEHQVIELSEARRRAKLAKEKAKVERVGQEIEHFTQTKISRPEEISSKNVSNFSEKETNETIVTSVWKTNQILSPEPMCKKEEPTLSQPEIRNTELNTVKKSFNFSDFESQSSSPFDYMELQTLNDLEELNTVFRGIAGPEKLSQNHFETEKSCPNSEIAKNVIIPNGTVDSHSYITSDYKTENFNREIDFANPKIYKPMSTNCLESLTANSFINSTSLGYSQPSDHTLNRMPNIYGASEDFNTRGLNSQEQTTAAKKRYDNYQTSFPINFDKTTDRPKCGEILPRLRNSKSTSDISVAKNEGVYSLRSQTPPPHSSTEMKYNQPASIKQEPSSSYSILNNFQSNQNHSTLEESLPNPIEELDVDQKKFALYLVDMGFPIERSARAVKHLGTDEKKVVDHLCQVQGLEESGYNGNDSETALHLHDYNVEEAKKYLDLLGQFQDLGFQKIAVRKALVRHKNDRDKTLDFLLT